VSLAYTEDSVWRNRAEFLHGREAIQQFLRRKWSRARITAHQGNWACGENRIAVRFAYEWHDDSGNWFRSYGNENWEFDAGGLMRRRIASINRRSHRRSRSQVSLERAGPEAQGSARPERPRPVAPTNHLH